MRTPNHSAGPQAQSFGSIFSALFAVILLALLVVMPFYCTKSQNLLHNNMHCGFLSTVDIVHMLFPNFLTMKFSEENLLPFMLHDIEFPQNILWEKEL